jgi:thymidylate kinase
MPGQLVVITGLDGVGKNFVAKQLQAADPGSILVETPGTPFATIRGHIDEIAAEVPAAHYAFYLGSVIHMSHLIERELERGNVYCVRYLIDTVAYHRALGLAVGLSYVTDWYRVRRPDWTFLLRADEDTRRQRISSRGKVTVGDRLVSEVAVRAAIEREYDALSSEYVAIVNADGEVGNVVETIRRHMRSSDHAHD